MNDQDVYAHYHFYWWCHRRHHMELRRTRLVLTVLSLVLLAAGTVVGPLIQNVWILAGLTWSSMVLKGFMEFRKYETKINQTRVAYTTYAKYLTPGKDLNVQELIWTHHMMIDLAPPLPDRIKARYTYDEATAQVDGYKKGSTPS